MGMSAQEGQYVKCPYGIMLHTMFVSSHSGITYDRDGNPLIRTRKYNSPPGMSGGGGGSRRTGKAVNDDLPDEVGEAANGGGNAYTGSNPFLAAYYHYQTGRRRPFHMSTTALDFSGISMQTPDIQRIVKNGGGYINLLAHYINQTSRVIGSVYFDYLGNNTFSLRSDEYDFDIRWNEGFTKRNAATLGAGLLHGPVIDNKPIPFPRFPFFGPSVYTNSGAFTIYFHGTITLDP